MKFAHIPTPGDDPQSRGAAAASARVLGDHGSETEPAVGGVRRRF